MAGTNTMITRMQRELTNISRDPPDGCAAWPVAETMNELNAQIAGPDGTPYEGGLFKLLITMPDRYPFEPPKVTFITPVHHPNIDAQGRICLDILNLPPKGGWRPSLNLSTMLISLRLLLSEPNPDDGLVQEVTDEFKYRRDVFNMKAREMTRRYAASGQQQPQAEMQQQDYRHSEPSAPASAAAADHTASSSSGSAAHNHTSAAPAAPTSTGGAGPGEQQQQQQQQQQRPPAECAGSTAAAPPAPGSSRLSLKRKLAATAAAPASSSEPVAHASPGVTQERRQPLQPLQVQHQEQQQQDLKAREAHQPQAQQEQQPPKQEPQQQGHQQQAPSTLPQACNAPAVSAPPPAAAGSRLSLKRRAVS